MLKEKPTQSRGASQNGPRYYAALVVVAFLLPVMAGLYAARSLTLLPASNNVEVVPTQSATSTFSKTAISTFATTSTSSPIIVAPSTPKSHSTTTIPVVFTFPPAPSKGIGISLADTLSGLSDADLNHELDDIASIGIHNIRIDVDWSVIQRRGPDSFDWKNIDRTVSAANKHNITVLGILVYTPSWARPSGCSSNRCAPQSPDDYARFAAAASSRYAPLGVHNWEIWNEPNMGGSWMPGANASSYVPFLKAAYIAIKGVDVRANVITGGLGPISTGDGNIAPLEYLASLYRAGAEPYFDGVGMHPYSFPVPVTFAANWNAWQQLANTDTSARSIMIKNGDAVKKIWITEYGAPTNGPGAQSNIGDYNLTGHTDHVSEALQALMLQTSVNEAQRGDWIAGMWWYSYRDLGTSNNTNENFFGLLRFDGTKKPAYTSLQEMLVP